MADELVEYHRHTDEEIRFVIADPTRDGAWLSVPEAETLWLDTWQ